ncbi:NUDIX hydrolase [Aurantiacibacter rhizosphaerae]|uniref:GDP-mannose pyrophosphatase n=1 Tax=Aurantiacibacter rhizosphaerae TaxID=2691582 RepID=A0A844XDD4_9SPHN|nr:NUDIX hydrolase [Aurantiacibacter rhizosphaerae]MWV27634.1 NUDIX domain-containing protein [Aurantiacibacter rhizosphaerae]
MSFPDRDKPEKIAWQGDWIVAKTRGKWEYATRARDIRAAVILPVDDGEIVLVEQYRIAPDQRCLELPAGLIGDDEGGADDDPLSAAKRELEEETGYAAAQWQDMGEFFSSPGMTNESFTLLKASGLTKVSEGGGTETEDIIVHRVKLADLPQVIADFRSRGVGIDTRILLALGSHMLGDMA